MTNNYGIALMNHTAKFSSSLSNASREDKPSTITIQGQEVAVVEEFVSLCSLVHLTTQSTPDISGHNAITPATMQNLDHQIWKSRISISTMLELYSTSILPIFLYGCVSVC